MKRTSTQAPDLSPGPDYQPPPPPATPAQRTALVELMNSPAFTRREKVRCFLQLSRGSFTEASAADLLIRGNELAHEWAADPAAYWQKRYEERGYGPDPGNPAQVPHLNYSEQWKPQEKPAV